jgi:hypothetical protein
MPVCCVVLCCDVLWLLQVAAGAQVILTQPPLDWPAFELWMEDARRRGLHTAARLVVGFPCLSSAANTSFWLALCNAGSNVEVRRTACRHCWAVVDGALVWVGELHVYEPAVPWCEDCQSMHGGR